MLTAVLLISCAAGDGGDSAESGAQAVSVLKGRLAMTELLTHDSAAVVTAGVADDMLRQAIDSIAPDAQYVTLEERANVLGPGIDTISVDRMIEEFQLDAVFGLRVARFGSIIGLDARLMDAKSDSLLCHRRTFNFIRYRASDDTKLLGPSLYTAIERIVAGCNGDSVAMPSPLIVANFRIPSNVEIDALQVNRGEISKEGVRAIGDMLRYDFQDLIVLDVESRSRVYETVGLTMVEDLEPVGNLERKAMYSLDLVWFLTNSIEPSGTDSVDFVSRLHRVTRPSSDYVVDSAVYRISNRDLQSLDVKKIAIGHVLEVARTLVRRHADMLSGGLES